MRRAAAAALLAAAVAATAQGARAQTAEPGLPGVSRPELATRPDIAERPDLRVAPLAGASLRGLCADPRLEGALVDEVEAPGRCGIPLPVRVDRAAGVALEPPAVLNCRTARALADWLERGPAASAPGLLGAPLAAVRISGAFACRTRNFRAGGRLSEHAAGNAVDLSGFRTEAGREVTLAADWREGAAGEFLLASWRAACGPFGTVLGPDHDAVHADHLHLDTAARPDGPVCR